MTPSSPRAVPWCLASAALVALLSCGAPRRELVRYDDPLVGGRLTTAAGEALAGEEATCALENRWSVRLPNEVEVSAPITVGPGAELTLSGCVGHAEEAGRPLGGDVLEVELAASSAAPRRLLTIPLPPHPGNFRQSAALDLPRGPAAVHLRARLPSGRKLFVRDLYSAFEEAAAQPAVPPRQVLLISVDTLRRDALSTYGGPWPTPALDRFAARSQTWLEHVAAASWTKPSHASLLSGQSPAVLGVEAPDAPLPAALPLLAERFRAAGFATGGLVFDCLWLNPPFGFSRGFESYRPVHWTLPQARRAVVNWIGEHAAEPFFFFFHTFEPHSDFRALPYEGPNITRRTVEDRFGVPGYGCREEQCASGVLAAINDGRIAPLSNEAEILRFLYGKGVEHVDAELGQLFADLEAMGLFESMMIVLTADHGESFLEHDQVLHGHAWEEVMRVPLLIKWPGGRSAGERRSELSSALDVAPTLAAAFGLAAGELPGKNLAEQGPERPVFAWDPGQMVYAGGWKAVFGAAGGPRLFHLADDPSERQNLAAARPEELARLERLAGARASADQAIAARLRAAPSGRALPTLSAEDIRRLQALGYLGGTPDGAPPPE